MSTHDLKHLSINVSRFVPYSLCSFTLVFFRLVLNVMCAKSFNSPLTKIVQQFKLVRFHFDIILCIILIFFRVTEAFQVQQEKRCALKLHKIDIDIA